MKVEILINGSLKLVVPENEIDRSVLAALSKTEIDAKSIENHTQILDKVIQEGLILSTKKSQPEQALIKPEN
jgi:hypothetical protein